MIYLILSMLKLHTCTHTLPFFLSTSLPSIMNSLSNINLELYFTLSCHIMIANIFEHIFLRGFKILRSKLLKWSFFGMIDKFLENNMSWINQNIQARSCFFHDQLVQNHIFFHVLYMALKTPRGNIMSPLDCPFSINWIA